LETIARKFVDVAARIAIIRIEISSRAETAAKLEKIGSNCIWRFRLAAWYSFDHCKPQEKWTGGIFAQNA